MHTYKYIQVSKGCGKRQEFETEFVSKGTFNSVTQCFVTNVKNSTQVKIIKIDPTKNKGWDRGGGGGESPT